MPKPDKSEDYELRDEYDLSKMTIVPKGRYASDRRVGKNVVLLAEDVVEVFQRMKPSMKPYGLWCK